MRRHFLVVACTALLLLGGALSLFGQSTETQSTTQIGRHYARGTATAPTQAEAQRLAKARAIEQIMTDLSKDQLFMQMLVSEYPGAIFTDEITTTDDPEAGFTVSLRVGIDDAAVNLTERPYEASVIGLLERAEGLIVQASTASRQAADSEAQLSAQEAYARYSDAKSALDEVRVILSPLADTSIFTADGSNLPSLRTRLEALETSVTAGLARIEQAESELAVEANVQRARQTLDAIEERVAIARELVERYVPRSPFFDIPEEELRSIEGELSSTRTELSDLIERLAELRDTIGEKDSLVAERTQIEISSARTLTERIDRMIEEVKEEIRYPRLKRQADQARRALRREKLWSSVAGLATREPTGYLSIEKQFGAVLDHRTGGEWRRPNCLAVTSEFTFVPGPWLVTTFDRRIVWLADGSYQRTLSQDIGVGLVRQRMLGIGFSWDWASAAVGAPADPEDTQADDEESLQPTPSISFYLGRPSRDVERIDLLIQARYRIPAYWGTFLAPYHLNAEVAVTARLPTLLVLEAHAASVVLPIEAAVFEDADTTDGAAVLEAAMAAAPHHLSFGLGVGLRLPAPVTWKVSYEHEYQRRADGSVEAVPVTQGWRFALEYSL